MSAVSPRAAARTSARAASPCHSSGSTVNVRSATCPTPSRDVTASSHISGLAVWPGRRGALESRHDQVLAFAPAATGGVQPRPVPQWPGHLPRCLQLVRLGCQFVAGPCTLGPRCSCMTCSTPALGSALRWPGQPADHLRPLPDPRGAARSQNRAGRRGGDGGFRRRQARRSAPRPRARPAARGRLANGRRVPARLAPTRGQHRGRCQPPRAGLPPPARTLIERGQETGDIDAGLPANWLLTACPALGRSAEEEVRGRFGWAACAGPSQLASAEVRARRQGRRALLLLLPAQVPQRRCVQRRFPHNPGNQRARPPAPRSPARVHCHPSRRARLRLQRNADATPELWGHDRSSRVGEGLSAAAVQAATA
jgi:hypothetical protein